jgi:hypothetical protein
MSGQDGKQQGPFSWSVMQENARSGRVHRVDLVWKEGLTDWIPAESVEGLFPAPAATTGSAPAKSIHDAAARAMAPIEKILAEMSSPRIFRLIGRVSGAISAVLLASSVALFAFGFSWFTGAVLFGILCILGEGVAAILHSLERLATMVSQRDRHSPSNEG